ncbi:MULTISPECIES: hypothetical protein [Streptomycetaceae]|uniref:hypothetical protein n=1 Tax=Streptomycetaceae TaxID=2062 RepID=UPI0011610A36|nr:hypothetical protein [Streptomyces sp. CB02056]
MTGQPTGGQWQWPQNAWQPPPVPTDPLPPWSTATPPRRLSRKAWTAAMVGTGAVLASVLAMCGPGSGDELSVAALPDASPTASDSTAARLLPVSPSPVTPAPSPLPPPTPGAAVPVAGPGTATAASGAGGSATPDAQHASASARPKPGHSPHTSTPARGPSGAPAPASTGAGGGQNTICDQAERAGHWPPGSDQARVCHSLYG